MALDPISRLIVPDHSRTIVTQFITTDGTDNGDLKEMRRFYVQDGRRIANSKVI